MQFQVRYLALFCLLSVIDGFGWFWMGSLHKNIYLMLEFPKASFLVLHFSCNTLMTVPDDVICNIAFYADDTTLYSNFDQASDLWQQIELASEVESYLRDTEDRAGSGLLILILEKLNWFFFTGLTTLVLLM